MMIPKAYGNVIMVKVPGVYRVGQDFLEFNSNSTCMICARLTGAAYTDG